MHHDLFYLMELECSQPEEIINWENATELGIFESAAFQILERGVQHSVMWTQGMSLDPGF
jgi:hypothetical protein